MRRNGLDRLKRCTRGRKGHSLRRMGCTGRRRCVGNGLVVTLVMTMVRGCTCCRWIRCSRSSGSRRRRQVSGKTRSVFPMWIRFAMTMTRSGRRRSVTRRRRRMGGRRTRLLMRRRRRRRIMEGSMFLTMCVMRMYVMRLCLMKAVWLMGRID